MNQFVNLLLGFLVGFCLATAVRWYNAGDAFGGIGIGIMGILCAIAWFGLAAKSWYDAKQRK